MYGSSVTGEQAGVVHLDHGRNDRFLFCENGVSQQVYADRSRLGRIRGGKIGAELNYAGYDALMISGKAKNLSIIHLNPDRVQIIETPELKGAGSFASESRIKKLIGDDQAKVLTIGPA